MPYTPTDWHDGISGGTSLSAENLKIMEQRLADYADATASAAVGGISAAATAHVVDAGSPGAALDLNVTGFARTLVAATLVADCVVTVSGVDDGYTITMLVVQDGVGKRHLSVLFGAVTREVFLHPWPGAITMVTMHTANGTDLVVTSS